VKCPVCGKDPGFWTKFGGSSNSAVCKGCQEQGKNRLQVLVRTISATQSWKPQYAEGWIKQLEDTVRRYELPLTEAAPARSAVLNEIFKLVEREPEISDADTTFLIGLGQKYKLARSATPEIRDTLLRISFRQMIESWQRGEVPTRQCSCPVPLRGEICHWEEPSGLLIERKKREYVGGYGSVSVPVPLLHGVRARIGGFKGVPVDRTVHEDGGRGILHITNQRILFTGQEHSVATPYTKVLGIVLYADGFEIHTSAAKKPGIFLVPHPDLTKELLTLASSPETGGNSPPRSRRKKPVPA